MSVDLNGFDADQVPESEFAPLPEGDYVAVISESEQKPTKAGDGSYVKLKIEIVDGDYKGRVLFENLNLQNKNETAVAIAKRALADICLAVDVPRPTNTAQLHNKPMLIQVKCEKRKDIDEIQNRIKKYLNLSGVSRVAPAATATASAAADPKTPPWKR
jgi:pentose-5-phosphate-3-epimerase